MNEKKVFKERLWICFKRKGLNGENEFKTIDEFARYLGVSRPTVSKWLNGNSKPSQSNLTKISKKLGKTADWLAAISDDSEYSADEKVKIASEYTGLSQASIEQLHTLSEFDATNEFCALNFLLEKIAFYREVLKPVSQAVLCARSSNPFGDAWDDLTEEEITMMDRLREIGFYHLDPWPAIEYLASQSGQYLSSFLRKEIEKQYNERVEYLNKWDEDNDKNYLEGLQALKEFHEEEALSDEDSES